MYLIVYFFLHPTDDSCQYWLDIKNKKLTSRDYPKFVMPDDLGCKWVITAPEGHIIALEFEFFEVSFKMY